ncbi:DUF58 domain-containing protein [bacterium]|jgi:uncharacterized protein (DUF58 family)|nr:DUF58 domain-containing protein [bacterium]MBT3903711.1 DUF58 domain-containing protein [bacterium]MBT5345892.1 DUF58 domain-containing protein [bacterium]MBT6131095.1 DUF58 domain-containing protein [bacterium]MBT6528671.1 DUF58 domain-containing protein [bacterium]
MLSPDIISLIRQLELATKAVMRGALVGDSKQRVPGFGSEFDQIREYVQGDDIRFIDWRGVARTGSLLVRQYHKQVSKTVYVMLDISGSTEYGSGTGSKLQAMRRAAAALIFAAGMRNDAVGLVIFSDKVHTFIKPKRSRFHVRALVEAIFSVESSANSGTDITCAIDQLMSTKVHESLVCIVSDMIDDEGKVAMINLSGRCDVVVLRCMDEYERMLPSIGLMACVDSEQGNMAYIDVRKSGFEKAAQLLETRALKQKEWLRAHSIDLFDFKPEVAFIPSLVTFFAQREQAL